MPIRMSPTGSTFNVQRFSTEDGPGICTTVFLKGCPVTASVLSLQLAGERALVCAEGLAADVLEPLTRDDPVAVSLLTLDVVSFQAKGRWLGRRRALGPPVGVMAVTAVYAGGPPIPGRQVA
jgi:hypothetical protein